MSWVCSTGSTYHTLDVDDANDTFGPDKQGEKEGVEVLELLESVDDDMDRLGVGMVKISEASAAKYEDGVEKFAVGIMVTNSEFLPPTIFFFCREWGINRGFGIVYFESGIPFMYQVLKMIISSCLNYDSADDDDNDSGRETSPRKGICCAG